MATTVHFVRRARVPNTVTKRGGAYYWWKLRDGDKSIRRESLTPPRPSQLTLSPYWVAVLEAVEALEDEVEDFATEDAARAYAEALERIQEDTEAKADAMVAGGFPEVNAVVVGLRFREAELEHVQRQVEAWLKAWRGGRGSIAGLLSLALRKGEP